MKKYAITLKFKYVKTLDNLADLLSRDLSINKFRDQFEFWVGGPQWLNVIPGKVPNSKLNCLSKISKGLFQTNVLNKSSSVYEYNPVISFDRFYSFNKFVKATALYLNLLIQ